MNRERAPVLRTLIEEVLGVKGSVRERGEALPREGFSVHYHLLDRFLVGLETVLLDDLCDAPVPHSQPRDLRLHIADYRVRDPRVGPENGDQVLVGLPRGIESGGGDLNSLLVDLRPPRPPAPEGHPAHVEPVPL